MIRLSGPERRSLLLLARSVIAAELLQEAKVVRPAQVSGTLLARCGCFVTLYMSRALRGCIGNIEATRSLIESVEENAVNSAFKDPRFPPLRASELPAVRIEISVLSVPQELTYHGADDLLDKLIPGIHGVIITKNWHSATFLPQVWQQLPGKDSFLENLCLKAGLEKTSWQEGDLSVRVYKVEHFSE
jgi:AmmeMemoRadiSam system protein A